MTLREAALLLGVSPDTERTREMTTLLDRKNAIAARLREQGASLGTIDALIAVAREMEAATIASYLNKTADIADGTVERPVMGSTPVVFDLETVGADTLRRVAAQVAR